MDVFILFIRKRPRTSLKIISFGYGMFLNWAIVSEPINYGKRLYPVVSWVKFLP